MSRSLRRVLTFATGSLLVMAAGPALTAMAANQPQAFDAINHIVVIYEENHSFDNLYGGWEGVNGTAKTDTAHTTQVDQAGAAFTCLLQNDVNLTSPPLPSTCTDTARSITSAFPNTPFSIDKYI